MGYVESACAREYSVLAVRVDFPYEEPDHDTTSGRGVFDLRDYYDENETALRKQYYHPWDVPPHNKRYFENHLDALNNYWSTVSEGKVSIKYEVWPVEPDSAYTLSKKFYKYGNGRTKEQTYEKLAGLLEEALTTCKQTEGDKIDFSGFDTFMVIHAGIGSETSGALNDIPSAYITKDDIQKYLNRSFIIDNIEIDNGIVVPEMAASNGYGGLNGIIAQMFGHRLGLPSLSNNEDGLPAAGGWCLMDTGAMSLGYRTRGFAPTHPCIWSKIDLGWLESLVVTADTTVDIAATHIDSGLLRAVKVPISADEYLLIENRIRYAPRDSLANAVYSDTDTSGVWLKVDHYDSYIPGSGILIWHINKQIIRNKRPDGAINDDIYRRGIDLLEADGRQDIGSYIGFGDPRGAYTEGHDDDTYKLNGKNRLAPDTNPHSGSMWGGNSGITITVNSDPGDTMNVSISFRGNMKGFPLFIGGKGNITAADLNGDGSDELIVSGEDSTYVIGSDGAIFGTFFQTGHPAVIFNSNTGAYNLVISNIKEDTSFWGYKTYGLNDSGLIEQKSWNLGVIASCRIITEGNVLATEAYSNTWLLFDNFHECTDTRNERSYITVSNPEEPGFLKNIIIPDTTHVKSMAAAQDYLAVLSKNNTLFLGYLDDAALSAYTHNTDIAYGPLMADLNRDNIYETIVTTDNRILIYQPDGTYETTFIPDNPVGEPVAADIDFDGYPEIIQCTEKGVYAFRRDGVSADGFPFFLPPGDADERITSPPVVADLNGDGIFDIAFATSNMRLVSYDTSGQLTGGFPISLRGRVESTPLIFKQDDTGSIAIAYLTTDGMLMAFDLGTTADKNMPWPMWKGNAGLNSALLNSEIPSDVQKKATFEVYCYPNPITGATGTFRITPDGPTDLKITLYTVDGSKVFERRLAESEVIPGVPNEIRMNASKLASGLYIARIETRRQTVFYKVGVLK